MSSDQRPGKVRVFSSGIDGDQPRRRRGDVTEAVATIAAPPPVPATVRSAAMPFPRLAALFLLGSAAGGAAIAWFGLIPGNTP